MFFKVIKGITSEINTVKSNSINIKCKLEKMSGSQKKIYSYFQNKIFEGLFLMHLV